MYVLMLNLDVNELKNKLNQIWPGFKYKWQVVFRIHTLFDKL